MENYFNTLPHRLKVQELAKCEFMDKEEFIEGVNKLVDKKIVIIGCGAQGLAQGQNLRDSGLNVAYALRKEAIENKRESFIKATSNGFEVGTFEELIPTADLVSNLTPDKQHTNVVTKVVPLMKRGACLSYSHGFNIVEEGIKIREDITVVMIAPKSPGSELRNEYLRGFGVPTLIAVHTENDPNQDGLEIAKAYCVGTGGHHAGVLKSSFVAEVKSDLMGEQTILCGLLQTGSILCFDKMIEKGIEPSYASKLVQYGWEVITEALKIGGITNMMDRLSNAAKIEAFKLSEELKEIMTPLFNKHMDDILSGKFSKTMMKDWAEDDKKLRSWRAATAETAFEKTPATALEITEQEYFDKATLMVAFVKSGVELAYETMVKAGIKEESAYYESLHEAPLIANTIARKKLFEMNRVISDTAEYGCYLFDHACKPLLSDFMKKIDVNLMGKEYTDKNNKKVDNFELVTTNTMIRNHSIEICGAKLRAAMTAMKTVVGDYSNSNKRHQYELV
ncbi:MULTISPECIES: ketol-acid reductoisomerase [Flavobacterium]|uniref:Ketol-acid reductoisomerase n=1 Tax=Flavobacterium columnare TaxID=996 RepID=A0AA94JQG4_9FLAO|nr:MULTISPECIES: ketol-acid reductoisomerase [Flavobacterium]MCH4828410.1 ketol-acid reductoisomerase [Flavobacterium columnare]MCH4832238.1 ketol-acid reductoisomerase [Flavobacterium columnare]OWP87048.1 ketol-acid reductoisomerase [Flavobacterium covae]QYS90253.1 ketol-acid reductoisomerase [Flavobacterium covae]